MEVTLVFACCGCFLTLYPTSIGEGGYVVPPVGFMREVKKMCESKVFTLFRLVNYSVPTGLLRDYSCLHPTILTKVCLRQAILFVRKGRALQIATVLLSSYDVL